MENSADDASLGLDHAARLLASELKLTQRQAEVLHWIAEGKSNGEIATILGCSINTVKAHLKDIFQRLGIHSRTAAAASAYRAHIRCASPARVIPQPSRPV